jgi:hypothetical protein
VAGAQAADLGQQDARGIADEHLLDGPLAGDEHAHLAADAREISQRKAASSAETTSCGATRRR